MHRLISILPVFALLACADRTRGSSDTAAGEAASTTGQTAEVPATAPADTQLLDPNTATREQLVAAGVDSATATTLIAGRPYADMLAVDKALATRLAEPARKQLYTKVWRRIDLNTAKGDEILLIPGVGPRMKHEFEEYRPYRSIEQFRREIGKYVNEAEVARLERYVRVN